MMDTLCPVHMLEYLLFYTKGEQPFHESAKNRSISKDASKAEGTYARTDCREISCIKQNSISLGKRKQIADFAEGAAIGMIICGIVFTGRYGQRIKAFKQRLLKKE